MTPKSLSDLEKSRVSSSEYYEITIGGVKKLITEENLCILWKEAFWRALNLVSPGFKVSPRNKDVITNIFFWMCPEFGESCFDPKKGLLLWGGVGTGKTTLIKGIQKFLTFRNQGIYACQNKNIGFELVSAAEISLRYASEGMKVLEKWTDREQISDLAIDEIGREEISSHFGTKCNTIQTVLQLRYEHRHKVLTLGTTNIDMESDDFANRYGNYIYDRSKEMFNIIEIGGSSRR